MEKTKAKEKVIPRLKRRYGEEILPKLREKFALTNPHLVPKLDKIVVNMGVGGARESKTMLASAIKDLTTITGQKPKVTKARNSIAGFHLREGMPIGCMVTLRGFRMWEFLDRVISVVIPRIRDFRGLSNKSFDGRGNYSMGFGEQIAFPEIDLDSVQSVQGMDITIVTTADTDVKALELLTALGMPFKK
jgi:large subunit ribosomal protein L5